MTKPTQAQIEAAGKAMQATNALFMLRDIPFHDIDPREQQHWFDLAQVGLTAAAEVEVKDWRDAKIKTLENTARINLSAYKTVKAELHATIERCAQVAESYEHLAKTINMPLDAIGVSDTIKYIAAAIRALKDNSHVLPIVHNGDGWIVDDAKPAIDPNLVYPGKDPDFVFPEET